VKQALHEMVILPALRPDLFTGLRQPPRGLLLYGPPGNGKTFIAKAVASEAKCSFFNISASSLVSRYFGEGEKLVRTLFTVAREKSPAIIFIDEIDSILSRRSNDEHEASRRLKTEFLVQFDGVASGEGNAHVVVIGATNMPESLDDAVIRRLTKRIYVGCPEPIARESLIKKLLSKQKHSLSHQDFNKLVTLTDGYSASDLTALCRDASMGAIRGLSADALTRIDESAIPPITMSHFQQSMILIKPTVSKQRIKQYSDWNTSVAS